MVFLQSILRAVDVFKRQSRTVRDVILIGVIGLPIYVAAMWFELLHEVFELASNHENHELDWLLMLVFCLGIAAMIFSARRMVDMHREVSQRRAAEAEALRLARHDVLTGLPNRRWFGKPEPSTQTRQSIRRTA